MLGDHHHWRKTYAYEGSARVPFLLDLPDRDGTAPIDRPVGLEDVAPTLLDAVGIEIPETVEGRSVLPLLDGDPEWRDHYHGEHGAIYHPTNACQYLVGERWKYVWNPVTGEESLFDLGSDPVETRNLAGDPDHADRTDDLRAALVDRLDGRSEGFVEDGELRTVDGDVWP
jgi:arylsulfatase A-like enzyme